MSQGELAASAKVSLETVKRLEGMRGPVTALVGTVDAIQCALEAGGVEFIPENGGGVGVRFRDKAKK